MEALSSPGPMSGLQEWMVQDVAVRTEGDIEDEVLVRRPVPKAPATEAAALGLSGGAAVCGSLGYPGFWCGVCQTFSSPSSRLSLRETTFALNCLETGGIVGANLDVRTMVSPLL